MLVEAFLRQDGIRRIRCAPTKRDVCHDRDQSVLLHVEWSWIKIPSDTKGLELPVGHDHCPANAHGVSDQLSDERGDIDIPIT